MKYRRKIDGVIVEANVSDHSMEFVCPRCSPATHMMSKAMFNASYEEIKEEKPMLVKMNCKECGKEHVVSSKAGYMCLTCSIAVRVKDMEAKIIKQVKPMHNFKVGDRVYCYNTNLMNISIRHIGIVECIDKCLLTIRTDSSGIIANYKQCRKLKKRERKRVWVHEEVFTGLQARFVTITPCAPESRYKEFIEVRKE